MEEQVCVFVCVRVRVCVTTKQPESQQVFYLHFDLKQFIFQQRRVSCQSEAAAGGIDVKHTVATWKENIYQLKQAKDLS